MMRSTSSYNPRVDALLAAPPPLLLGSLLPLLLGGLRWLDGRLGTETLEVLRIGPWFAGSTVTALIGLLLFTALAMSFFTAIAAAILLRFPLWHHGWSATTCVLALAFVASLSQGNLSPMLLALATPLLLLAAATWVWAWRREPTQAGLFGLSATQALTLVMLLGAASPPLLRPDLIPWAVPLGLANSLIVYATVIVPPERRLRPLCIGALVNLLPLPLLNGTRIASLWVGPRGLMLLAILAILAILAGPLWRRARTLARPSVEALPF